MFEFIPDAVFGIPVLPLIGLVLGIVLAVNEATRTKFKDVALKVKAGGEEIIFDSRYLISAILGIVVVMLTVISVKDAGILNAVPNDATGLFTALMAGFTEGWAVIKMLNKRIDLYIKKKAMECGASEEQAQKIAEAVEFVEVEEKDEPKVSFDEL